MKLTNSLFALLLLCMAFTVTSCGKGSKTATVIDKCLNVTCANGGVCDTGSCTCPTGYGGANCEIEERDLYVGNWTVIEKGSTTNEAQYTTSVSNGANTDLNIANFFNFFRVPVTAYVSSDTIYLPTQHLQGKTLVGRGYLETTNTYGQYGAVVMAYEITDSATNTTDDFGYISGDGTQPSVWTR